MADKPASFPDITLQQVITFLTQMQKIVNIPITLYEDGHLIRNISPFPSDMPDLCHTLLRRFGENSAWQAGTTVSPGYIFYGYIHVRDTAYCAYLGPCTSFALTDTQMRKLLDFFGLPKEKIYDLRQYLRPFAHPKHTQFTAAMELLNNMINYPRAPIQYHAYPKKIHTATSPDESSGSGISDSDASASSAPASAHSLREVEHTEQPPVMEFEQKVMTCIRSGKTEQLADLIDSLPSYSFSVPQVMNNLMDSLTTIFIAADVLAARSAVEGGLDYDTAISIQDHYIALMKQADNYLEFNVLFRSMLLDFANRVASCQIPDTDSILVKRMCQAAQKHLYESYDLADMADDFHMNAAYLSRHFKEETGINFTSWLSDRKIKEAEFLLSETDMSLAEVSASLAYSSQNYFQKVFRKTVGLTPAEYRRQNHLP